MSVFEEKGCLTYKDKNGDLYRLYPQTKKECIEGLEDIDSHLLNSDNPHNVDPAQIGAIPVEDIASENDLLEYLNINPDAAV